MSYSNVHFSTSSLTLRGTAKTVRARYGKLIKAEGKVVEQLGKSKGGAEGEAEISRLEEAASKAQEEVMKAKERRREMDKKRASDVEEKAKKEVLRLKKEENAALERKEKQAEKDKEKEEKKRQPTEKELKEAALLEKQRSVMLGFFNTPKPSSGAGGAAGGVGASSSSRSSSVFPTRVLTNRAGLGAAMGSTAALSHTLSHTLSTTHSLTATTSSSSSSSATVQYSIDLSDDQDPTGTHTDNGCAESAKRSFELAFEKDMTAKISMGEISRSLRERCVMRTKQCCRSWCSSSPLSFYSSSFFPFFVLSFNFSFPPFPLLSVPPASFIHLTLSPLHITSLNITPHHKISHLIASQVLQQ